LHQRGGQTVRSWGAAALAVSVLALVLALVAPAIGGRSGPSTTKLAKQIRSLQAQVAALQLKQGPRGEQGPPGEPGPSSGAAGGALTGTYPNPLIASNAVGSDEIIDGSVGAADLKARLAPISDTELIQPGGVPIDVRADCPAGGIALSGGGYWQFDSGQIAGIRNYQGGIVVTGTNKGNAAQNLTAFAICLPA
jgi:hypothetical protein